MITHYLEKNKYFDLPPEDRMRFDQEEKINFEKERILSSVFDELLEEAPKRKNIE